MEDPILALREASNSTLNTQHVASTTAMTSTTRSSSSLSVLEEDSKHIEAQSSPLIMRSTEGNPDFVRKLRLSSSNDVDIENLFPPRKSSNASSGTSTGTSEATSIENETRSPLKPLRSRTARSPSRNSSDPPVRSARRQSVNRFPVKVSVSRPISPLIIEEAMSLDSITTGDPGHTPEILTEEGRLNIPSHAISDIMVGNMQNSVNDDAEDEDFADMTAYSQFSAVPDMTMLAKLGGSPLKTTGFSQTPRQKTAFTSNNITGTNRSTFSSLDKSTTPTKSASHQDNDNDSFEHGNTTNLIIDFTQQFDQLQRQRMSPSKTAPDLLSYTQSARTPSPSKHRQVSSNARMSHLLDFDIPPAPTPRSVPTITPRELETLKSNFLSEISSLKSSLMGSQAEVQFLKTAVGDAEKRVGTCLEQLREESNLRAAWEAEKESWENRGREMEDVLRNVKEEIGHVEEERERLEGRLQESEMRREAAESMAQEAESKMAGMKAASAVLSHSADPDKKSTSSSREVEIQVERVARELHTLYKGKHEAKVAALKKSYETKWDKRIKQLEEQLETLSHENEHLRNGKDTTMNRVMDLTDKTKADEARQIADAKRNKELEARLEEMEEEARSARKNYEALHQELEREREEKGELVLACDELLALQSAEPISNSETLPTSIKLPPAPPKHTATLSSPRRPVSTMGLQRPSSSSSNGEAPRPGLPKVRPMSMMRAPGAFSGGAGTPLASRIGKMGAFKGRVPE